LTLQPWNRLLQEVRSVKLTAGIHLESACEEKTRQKTARKEKNLAR
jgi:hypothetical protein